MNKDERIKEKCKHFNKEVCSKIICNKNCKYYGLSNCYTCIHKEICQLRTFSYCEENVKENGCEHYQREIADDEIIIKKSKIDTMIWTVGELAKKLTHSQHKTAKEILQIVDGKLDLYGNGVIGGTLYDDGYRNAVNELKIIVKNKYDIELE